MWAAAAYFLIERWSRRSGWSGEHRLAAVLATTLSIMTYGWSGPWSLSDIIFRVAMGGAAVVLLFIQWHRLSRAAMKPASRRLRENKSGT
jgi:hypothetical protein